MRNMTIGRECWLIMNNMLIDEDDDGWLMRIILAKTKQHDTGVGEGGWKC